MEQGDTRDPGLGLTQRQLLIWTEQMLAPELPANNMVMSFSLEGAVDHDRFERAFNAVVEECEALRTVVRLVDDSPKRFIRPHVDAPLEFLDLSREADPELAYKKWRDARAATRFDLGSALFDSVLVRLSARRSVWYLCQHHLICDAWSFGLVFDWTARLYEDPTSRDLPTQAGLSEKQMASERAYLESDRFESDRHFWRERFAEPIEKLLPYGVDPAGKGAAVRYSSVDLGATRSARLRRLATEDSMRAATPTLGLSLLFTTAFYAYLHRISGNRVLGIGSPVQNRPSRWSKSAVGRYAETCPMRVRVEPGESFRSLHAKVVEESFAVLSHARMSLANPVHAKRYDAMLNFHNASMRQFAGLPVESDLRTGLGSLPDSRSLATDQRGESWGASEVLTLNVHDFEGSGNFRLAFDFNADVFDEGLRRRAVEHFVHLLDAMLEDAESRIDAAAIVTPNEFSQAMEMEDASDGTRPPDEATNRQPAAGLISRFREHATAAPDRLAIIAGETRLSYREVEVAVERLASRLRAAALSPDARVAVLLGNTPARLISFLAIHGVGGAIVPIDPNQPRARLAAILAKSAPALILTDSDHGPLLPEEGPERIELDTGWEEVRSPGREDLAEPAPESLAYILYTSGTIGQPLGIEVEHRALSHVLAALAETPGLGADDRLLALPAASVEGGLAFALLPLFAGASVELIDADDHDDDLDLDLDNADAIGDPAPLGAHLEDPAISVVVAPNSTWQRWLDAGGSGRPGLRLWSSGHEMPSELADGLLDAADSVWKIVGAEETLGCFAVEKILPGTEPGSLGQAILGTKLRVLTPSLESAPLGAPGELHVRSAGLARGYRGQPEHTANLFPFRVPGEFDTRLHRTGLRVRQPTSGRFEVLGRVDERITIEGVRIEVAEIEANLRQREDVLEAAVVAEGDGLRTRHLVAHLELDKESEFEAEALAASLRVQLPAVMVPTHWHRHDPIPRTPDGAIDRLALLGDPRVATEVVTAGEPPRDDVEVQIAALWRELLDVPRVSREDDFFDLGGQSLLAVEAVRRLSALLGRRIELATFFEHSTLAGLRQALATKGLEHERTLAVELRRGEDTRPLFCIGGVHLYQALADGFSSSLSVYGISVHQELAWIEAVERGERPRVPSTEETAAECIATLRKRQPHGPYRLAGLSYGGVLAYEIAQQLLREGEQVEGLVLLDARLRTALGGARGRFGGLRRRLRNLIHPAAGAGWRRWSGESRDALRDRLFVEAVVRYEREIEPYSGSALLYRACGHAQEEIDFDESLGWGTLIHGGLTLADCAGDHVDMLSPAHAEETAREIERYFEQPR